MGRPTDRDDSTQLPEFKALLRARTGATLPCEGGTEWTSDNPRTQQRAANLCNGCAALTACRNYALAARMTHGVWGGTTPANRKRIRRRQRAA